tara:strand:- start:6374 stop:6559 length:186 start_codon:yes stop_codon:yes gene_type:complete
MDREISTLHQRISRLVTEAKKITEEEQGQIDLGNITEEKWRQLAAQIDIRVKGMAGHRVPA